ncbi:hypothetical protein WN943_015702 [Citrus x changshan-huyou]
MSLSLYEYFANNLQIIQSHHEFKNNKTITLLTCWTGLDWAAGWACHKNVLLVRSFAFIIPYTVGKLKLTRALAAQFLLRITEHNYLELTDDELFRECEMDAYKSSGPGGQHRNKRESAVRLKHVPTGVIAHAAEDRSQHKNRASALSHSFGPQSEEQLSTGALSRLILPDDSLRMAVNEFRTSKVTIMGVMVKQLTNHSGQEWASISKAHLFHSFLSMELLTVGMKMVIAALDISFLQ